MVFLLNNCSGKYLYLFLFATLVVLVLNALLPFQPRLPICPFTPKSTPTVCKDTFEFVTRVVLKDSVSGNFFEGCNVATLNGSGSQETLFLYQKSLYTPIPNGYQDFPCQSPYNAYLLYGNRPLCAQIDDNPTKLFQVADSLTEISSTCSVFDPEVINCPDLPIKATNSNCPAGQTAVMRTVNPPVAGDTNSLSRFYCANATSSQLTNVASVQPPDSAFVSSPIPCSDSNANLLLFIDGKFYCAETNDAENATTWNYIIQGSPYCSS